LNSKLRTGIGIDAHQFGEGGPLALAGLVWPETKKLVGHSDGDAAAHAICDAVLSACQLGDVGSFFGVDKPETSGISGCEMIKQVRGFVVKKGFAINNVAVQIIGNTPNISSRRDEAQLVLTESLGAPVSVSGTTTDSMGFTGRGEGVCAIATAMVQIP
jgi:2-C-methyl-D-erythritol 2,4-cyclodiphosphate synthase